jgi:LytS/YehU family sensor histidine kinase
MSEQPASIQITDFKINDELPNLLADTCFVTGAKHINEMEYLKLPPTKNTISFHFIAIDFSDPNATQLKYRLEPYDKTWVVLSKGEPGFSRYSNLPSGDYTLKIMGANSDGFWHDNAYKTLKIRVEPKLIEQLWFQLFLGLLGIFIIGLIYTLRVRQIKEKAILKTRAAENKMAALRAQMNPHFAFNSLQSINGFIAKNDMLGAFEYVSQFSDLMRMILENSRQNRISLEQEINLLELYLEIEALRFANPFEFDIDIAEDIDTFGIQIPAMLLQPFVENSIKHGLFHKKEKGKLQISFSKENSFLKCIIEDDGIGRDQAKKLNKQRGRKHKSRGLEIIKEQLDILRQSGFGKAYVEIIDLYADKKESIGTRVELLLPV